MTTRSGTKSALLVVDVQVGVVANAWQRDQVVQNVAISVSHAREAGVPVIWVQHNDQELVRGTPAWQLVPELEALPDDLHIQKSHNSAFEGTELLGKLDHLGVARIYLAGAATNWCIRATAYSALERGFDVTLISDAHTTEDLEIGPGRVVEARSMVEDLNVTMRWLDYPERVNSSVPAAEVVFE
jgi:nicotinamidase-related amidase